MTTVNQLLKRLLRVPKKNREQEIFVQARYPSMGNIASPGQVKPDKYGFFGIPIDCYIIKEEK